ncbi:MAG: hypothetical protein IIA83_09435 [Thaumarchaeota archaeon]|nr:hypothetical protein [Nitrososphaerota archaeon]
MENYNPVLEPSLLVNILTLRYDPSIKSNLPKKIWKDFEPIDKSPSVAFIEKSICNSLEQKYIDKPELDVRYVNKFLGMLAFEIWYRLFITTEIGSEDTLD